MFITSIISKLYEKIKLKQNSKKINNGISKYQCGGTKGKSSSDNIMTLNAIIDYNNLINTEAFILFADAHKCFDKLRIKNCIIDLYKITGAKEAMDIYRMNEKGNAIVNTPIGNIGPIEVNGIVRQGTIMGPKLCCINTNKINSIGRKCITTIGPNVKTETLIYVDDIQNASSNVEQLEKAVINLQCMEETKGYTFNNDVNKTAILIINKKKKKKYNIELNIKNGLIKQTNDYKYLGEWYNEKGDHSTTIAKRRERELYYIKQIKFSGNEYKLGKSILITRLKIYKTVIIPTIFYNVETWSNINKKEINELERIQASIIKSICEQRITTPYYGILSELGIWPVEQQIEYKKIMLLHNIVTTEGERLLKEVINDQIEQTWKGCWTEQVKTICNKYNINIYNIKEYNKQKLKTIVKQRIDIFLNMYLQKQIISKTKLRFVNNFTQEQYLEELEFQDSIKMIKIRLNMIEVKCNYKTNYANNKKCELCKEQEDTTEHLIECKMLTTDKMITVNDIKTVNKDIVSTITKNIKQREQLGYKIQIGMHEGNTM